MSRELAKSQLRLSSSHPATLQSRQRRWAIAGAAPTVGFFVLMVLWWRFGGLSFLGMIQRWSTWLPLALGFAAFGASLALTVSLGLRASTVSFMQGLPKGRRSTKVTIWVALTLIVALGAFLLSRGGFLSWALGGDSLATLRLVGHLLGTLPMLLLLLACDHYAKPVDEWGEREAPKPITWRSRLWRIVKLLWQVGIFVTVMVMIDRVAAWVDIYEQRLRSIAPPPEESIIAGFLKWVPGLDSGQGANVALADFIASSRDWIGAVVVLGALALLVNFLFTELFTGLGVKSTRRRPVGPRDVAEKLGYLRTPSGETWRLPAGAERPGRTESVLWEQIEPTDEAPDEEREQDGGDAGAGTPPEWFEELRENAGLASDSWRELQRARLDQVSPIAARDDLAHLFPCALREAAAPGGPTQDQVAALERFDQIFDEFLEENDREQQCVYGALDLLVTGPPGSGKTSLLLACALNAVVTRGQSVMVFVPTESKAKLFVDRLRVLAANAGVGWHVAVGLLVENDVKSWSDPLDDLPADKGKQLHRSPIGSLPDILVGTLLDYERLLYGADFGGPMVRRALLRMQSVMLEDLTAFPAEERRHLPFLLDKHRLILQSEQVPMQFLALAPDLTDQLARDLGDRLFSARETTNHLRLRPPARQMPWIVDLVAPAPEEAAEQISAAAARAGVEAVLWRPGASQDHRSRLEARLQVRVITDVDELDADDEHAAALAVYRSNTTKRATQTLCARIHGQDAVIVRVTTHAGAGRHAEQPWSMPVLPSVESEALSVRHLKSAARYLAAWTPIPRDCWARLGLRAAGKLQRAARGDVAFEAVPAYQLVLDPPEHKVEAGAVAAKGQMWPWVAMQTEASGEHAEALPMPPPAPVPLMHPFSRGEHARLDDSRARLFLGTLSVDEKALASWETTDSKSLHKMDLAYADLLLQRRKDDRFWPETIQPGASSGEALHIRGKRFEDRGGGETYMAVWDVEVRIPRDTELVFSQGGIAGHMLRWATLVNAKRGAAQPVDANFWLSGTYHEFSERPAPINPPLPVYYEANVGMLRLGAVDSSYTETDDTGGEALKEALCGTWNTRSDLGSGASSGAPWPVLGLALSFALREALPGLFEYTRIATFRGPTGSQFERCAFLLFVEPIGTRGTARDAIERLLIAPEMLEAVCAGACTRLRAVGETSDAWRSEELGNLAVEAGVQVGVCDSGAGLAADLDGAIALLDELTRFLRESRDRIEARLRRRREGGANGGRG